VYNSVQVWKGFHLSVFLIADVDEGGAGQAVPASRGAAQAQSTREGLVKYHIVQIVRWLGPLLYADYGAPET
jgi:hypothetical protein